MSFKLTISLDIDADADLIAFISGLGRGERNAEILSIIREHMNRAEGKSISDAIIESLQRIEDEVLALKFIAGQSSVRREIVVSGGSTNIDLEVESNLMELGK